MQKIEGRITFSSGEIWCLDIECKAQGGVCDGSEVYIVEISPFEMGNERSRIDRAPLTGHRGVWFGAQTVSIATWLKLREKSIQQDF